MASENSFELISVESVDAAIARLGEQAASVSSREELEAFLDDWLCGPRSDDRLEGAPVSPLLNGVAWCLGEMGARGGAGERDASWGLFARVLLAATYYGTREYEEWLGRDTDSTHDGRREAHR